MTALELTPAEQAAMRTDLHATTCPVPLGECVECMSTLRTVRKVITAVEGTLKFRLEVAEQGASDYRYLADEIGALAGDGWDDDAAEPDILARFVKHLATFHPDCSGRFCDDGSPVAACSTDESLEGVDEQ